MTIATRLALLALPLTLLASASSAPAQNAHYDANCKPVTEEDRLAQLEVGETHPIIGLGLKLNDKVCGGRNFLVRLFKSEPDPDKIDAGDVIEASKPAAATSVPDGMTSEQWKAKQERWRWERDHPNWRAEAHAAKMRNTNAANDASNFPEDRLDYTIIPPTNPNGFITIFQAKAPPPEAAPVSPTTPVAPPTLNNVQGEGTLLSPTGIARGLFNRGKLQGRGEEVLADGTWRGGEYKDGKLNGEGFELREEDGQPVITEGNFANDKPDGTVTRIYTNGNMRRALWGNGEQLAEGTLVAAGGTPPDPVYKSPEQLAAEADADFDKQLAAVPSAAALYAMADEYSEKGDSAKARRAYRTLMTRFPTSPLADRAAGQLAAITNNGASAPQTNPQPSVVSAATGTSASTTGAVYKIQIPNPVMPQSFYAEHSGYNLPIDECNRQSNDPVWSARFNALPHNSSAEAMRAVIISEEALLIVSRQCEQVPGGLQELQNILQHRAQVITTCQQMASSPDYCLAPYRP